MCTQYKISGDWAGRGQASWGVGRSQAQKNHWRAAYPLPSPLLNSWFVGHVLTWWWLFRRASCCSSGASPWLEGEEQGRRVLEVSAQFFWMGACLKCSLAMRAEHWLIGFPVRDTYCSFPNHRHCDFFEILLFIGRELRSRCLGRDGVSLLPKESLGWT